MTLDPAFSLDAEADPFVESEPMHLVGGRIVSLRFIRMALRRRRRLWVSLAVLGLLIGVGYHLVVPVKYWATTTLYLAAPPGTNLTVASANNLAMLGTDAVGQRAIALLGEHDITPSELLGKAPGVAVSDNVLNITISGTSPEEAVRRTNAVAKSYLAFRAAQDNAQNQAIVTAANVQIAKLQAEIDALTTQIDAAGTQNLIAERAAYTIQVTDLRQEIATEDLDMLSVSRGSKVISPATLVHTSKKKVLALDGLSGLGAGLSLGLLIVVLEAVLSDRLRRREDIAALLGAPVQVSIGRVGRRRFFIRRPLRAMISDPDPGVQILVQYLRERLAFGGSKMTELVVAVDDVTVPAAAMASLARILSSSGDRVVLVDATVHRELANALGVVQVGSQSVRMAGDSMVTLLVPPRPWESDDASGWEYDVAGLAKADAVLVVATIDPAVGAWHLRKWAADAVVTVSSGRSTGHRISAIAEMLEAADVTLSTVVLLGADEDDESVGLPEAGTSVPGRRLGSIRSAVAAVR